MKNKRLKILGVIGDPVSHSLSPLMHNAALAHLELPYLYMPFHVKGEDLESFLNSLRKRNIVGLNVTIPHKQAVIPFMDTLSREARIIGAVNTIVIQNGKLIGRNTDGTGYITSLEQEAGFSVANKQVMLLGAGGAARAIAVALGLRGAREVLIVNRTVNTAHNLADELRKKFPETVFGASASHEIESYFWKATDLLVNATSMGMKGKTLFPLPLTKLPPKTLVSDIVYTPSETPLLKMAKKLKRPIHPGWGMLLYQGALAFEMWTGKKAPVTIMKEALLSALTKKS